MGGGQALCMQHQAGQVWAIPCTSHTVAEPLECNIMIDTLIYYALIQGEYDLYAANMIFEHAP